MLKRLYVHNYKCLVNFEINFNEDINLFLGANGSGKTSVFSALYEVQQFILRQPRLNDKDNKLFLASTLTRWGEDNIQKFELIVDGNEGSYQYVLEIEHDINKSLKRIKTENLFFNAQPLFKSVIDNVNGELLSNGKLFNDNVDNQGVFYPTDWLRSSLESIHERHDNKKLTWFKNWLKQLFITQIYPNTIDSELDGEEEYPERYMSNYAAWLNHWNNENREGVLLVEQELREIIKGFSSFKFSPSGRKKILDFKINTIVYHFDELSDGQKALAVLYTIIYCIPDNSVICIDEPDNFLALPEIQPWLNLLHDQCAERGLQVILISHHPSLINFLTANSGYWFSRENYYSHTRIEKIAEINENGLSLAQLIELGWVYAG